jgi:hypothetical protein
LSGRRAVAYAAGALATNCLLIAWGLTHRSTLLMVNGLSLTIGYLGVGDAVFFGLMALMIILCIPLFRLPEANEQ